MSDKTKYLKIGDKVFGPHDVFNPNTHQKIEMTVEAVDVAPGESAKIKAAQGLDVRYVNCSYVLNDMKHVETFREDSLRPVS